MISEQSVTKKLDQYKSTLPRRERPCCVAYFSRRTYFNPRSHEGSDAVSAKNSPTELYFNPRSHEGSDENGMNIITQAGISIHAPTKGATRDRKQVDDSDYHFNPRSHEGSDGRKDR